MKILSWYIKGIKKREDELIKLLMSINPNICCLQNIATLESNIPNDIKILKGYECFPNGKVKEGGNGILTLTDIAPLSVENDIEKKENNIPGLISRFEFDNFYLCNVFLPHLGDDTGKKRLFAKSFIDEVLELLERDKPIILVGQFNIAPAEIDIYDPVALKNSVGFREQDREIIEGLLNNGFIDVYRYLHPDKKRFTTWESLSRSKEWEIDKGWRTDLFLVSEGLKDSINSCEILKDTYTSDHAPILLDINI